MQISSQIADTSEGEDKGKGARGRNIYSCCLLKSLYFKKERETMEKTRHSKDYILWLLCMQSIFFSFLFALFELKLYLNFPF